MLKTGRGAIGVYKREKYANNLTTLRTARPKLAKGPESFKSRPPNPPRLNTPPPLHWRRAKEVYRISTAPDHPEIKTFPRHIHAGREEDVKPDTITSLDNPPEENLRRVLKWVREKLSLKH